MASDPRPIFERIQRLDALYLKHDEIRGKLGYGASRRFRRHANRVWRQYVALRDDKADLRRCLRALG
jgi:hypothetical protein